MQHLFARKGTIFPINLWTIRIGKIQGNTTLHHVLFLFRNIINHLDVGQVSVSRGVWTKFVDSAGQRYSKMNSRLRHIQGITTFCVESDIQQGQQIFLPQEKDEDDNTRLIDFEDFPIDLSSNLFFESQCPQFEREDITFSSSHQKNRKCTV